MREVLVAPLFILTPNRRYETTELKPPPGIRKRDVPEIVDYIVINPYTFNYGEFNTPHVLVAVHGLVGRLDLICQTQLVPEPAVRDVKPGKYQLLDVEMWLRRGPKKWPLFKEDEVVLGLFQLQQSIYANHERMLMLDD